jgi:hypothetical protein
MVLVFTDRFHSSLPASPNGVSLFHLAVCRYMNDNQVDISKT